VSQAPVPRLEMSTESESPHSKLDLLVRVRYRNEVPPPSFPPQLVQIPDDLDRFTRPEWISEYASTIPAPMLVDSEGGMPLDLNRYDGVWTGEMAGERLGPSLR
jgi:RNA polymerase II-associated factor 1